MQEMSWRPLNMESFHHNLTEATKRKTYLTKAVKEYEYESGFIWSQNVDFCHSSSFNKKGSLVSSRARFLKTVLFFTIRPQPFVFLQ